MTEITEKEGSHFVVGTLAFMAGMIAGGLLAINLAYKDKPKLGFAQEGDQIWIECKLDGFQTFRYPSTGQITDYNEISMYAGGIYLPDGAVRTLKDGEECHQYGDRYLRSRQERRHGDE